MTTLRATATGLLFRLFPPRPDFDSHLEQAFFDACQVARIYGLRHHTRIGVYEADFTVQRGFGPWRRRLVIEVDGWDYHNASVSQRLYDEARTRYMVGRGWYVIRFLGTEVYHDAAGCAEAVQRVLDGGEL